MTEFAVTLVNITDGTVSGHKAGCADLKRGNLRKHADDAFDLDVASKADARACYNGDFDYDKDGWYEINWSPCANHVPEGDIAEFLTVAEAEPTMAPEQVENARRNFADLAADAPSDAARTFWQGKLDALKG